MSVNNAFDAGSCVVSVLENDVIIFSKNMSKGQTEKFIDAQGASFRVFVDTDSRVHLYSLSTWGSLQFSLNQTVDFKLGVAVVPSYPANHALLSNPVFESLYLGIRSPGGRYATNAAGTIPRVELLSALTEIAAGDVLIEGVARPMPPMN